MVREARHPTSRTRKPRRTRPSGWGGPRPGSGRRPKGDRAGVPHARREAFHRPTPAHVTLRVKRDVWNLRANRMMTVIRASLAVANAKGRIRIVHYSIQGNHLHLVVEAADQPRLSRGMQGLGVSLARRLNRVMERQGSVFADRYYARPLTSASQVRNTLAYVLNNRRRHVAAGGRAIRSPDWIDPCSSGRWFDGWRGRDPAPPPEDAVVVPAEVWLLRVGWRVRGLIEVDHVPGRRPPLGA